MLIQPLILALLALSNPQPAGPKIILGDCSLTVGGRVILNIKRTCRIDMDDDGGFSINTREGNERDKRPFHFAYLSVNGDGTASVSWNAEIHSLHADNPLGDDFRRKGGCWVGRRATICAFRR